MPERIALSPRAQCQMLEVAGVTKCYGPRQALREVELAVAPEQIVALIGPNGAGKTTLLSIVAGLLRADAGTVEVNGCDVGRDPVRAQRSVGFAPQSTGLYEPLTVEENLKFFAEMAGLRRPRLEARLSEVCEGLLLDTLRSRPCHRLSGGEKRRVHTAIALISDPPLVMLDEPTVGADIPTRQALVELVRGLASRGTAILYTTHYLPEVEALGATVVLIESGRVIARGSIDELIADHGFGEVEIRFRGPAPSVTVEGLSIRQEGDCLRVPTPAPALAAAEVLNKLDADIHRLVGVSILRPSLESAFVSLTGSRLPAPGAHDAA